MTSATVILRPTCAGWGVYLNDGRQIARFHGPFARLRALRWLRSMGRVDRLAR